jgi:hypothetical protein
MPILIWPDTSAGDDTTSLPRRGVMRYAVPPRGAPRRHEALHVDTVALFERWPQLLEPSPPALPGGRFEAVG